MEEVKIKEKHGICFKGIVEIYESEEDYELGKFKRRSANLWVDDGKELTLDFLFGLLNWWGTWDQNRYMGYGTSMFNNSSFERASGIIGISSGSECEYPVVDTYLVSPEDSFLSHEVGIRIPTTITRRDQTVEIRAYIEVPYNVSLGEELREFGMFLKASGPTRDPSLSDAQKPYTMICRSALSDTGYFAEVGGVCTEVAKGTSGAVLCYKDDPYVVSGNFGIRWKFGEL